MFTLATTFTTNLCHVFNMIHALILNRLAFISNLYLVTTLVMRFNKAWLEVLAHSDLNLCNGKSVANVLSARRIMLTLPVIQSLDARANSGELDV